jgi:hypothetical protein
MSLIRHRSHGGWVEILMDENPYRAPESIEAIDPKLLYYSKIVAIARYQRGVMVCILVYLLALIGRFALPVPMRVWVSLAILGVGVAGLVYVLLLAMQLYNATAAIFLGVATLIPCVGLLVLLAISQKATKILQMHGLRVGLLGASLPVETEQRDGQ